MKDGDERTKGQPPTRVAVQVAARHHVGGRPAALGREDDTVDEMSELRAVDGDQLLEVARVQTGVARDEHVRVGHGAGHAVAVVRHAHRALALAQDPPRVGDAEEETRARHEDAAPLALALVEHAAVFLAHQPGHLVAQRLLPGRRVGAAVGQQQPLGQVGPADQGQEAEGGALVAHGLLQEVEVLALLAQQHGPRDAEGVEQRHHLVVEVAVDVGPRVLDDGEGVVVAAAELAHRLPELQQRRPSAALSGGGAPHARVGRHHALVAAVPDLQDRRRVAAGPEDDGAAARELLRQPRRHQAAAVGEDVAPVRGLDVGYVLAPLGRHVHGHFGGGEEQADALGHLGRRLHAGEVAEPLDGPRHLVGGPGHQVARPRLELAVAVTVEVVVHPAEPDALSQQPRRVVGALPVRRGLEGRETRERCRPSSGSVVASSDAGAATSDAATIACSSGASTSHTTSSDTSTTAVGAVNAAGVAVTAARHIRAVPRHRTKVGERHDDQGAAWTACRCPARIRGLEPEPDALPPALGYQADRLHERGLI